MRDDHHRGGLDRRAFLKLAAGVPLVIGLGSRARLLAGEGEDEPADGADAIRRVVARARAGGRQVVLLGVPAPNVQGEVAGWVRRRRIAKRLHALIESTDVRHRVVLGAVAIVIAPVAQIREAMSLPAIDADATLSPAWLADLGGARHRLERRPRPPTVHRLAGALDGTEAQASELIDALGERILGADLAALRSASAVERELMAEADRATLDADMAALADPAFETREAATRRLRERRAACAATLGLLALTASDPEVRRRCAELAGPDGRVEPIGAAWGEFHAACGQTDPYSEALARPCGMAHVDGPGETYLRITAE